MSLSILDIISILFLFAGLAFFLGASVGLLRFPDFYTRMHAAGKGDTLSTLMIMAGAAVYELNRLDPGEGNVISVLFIVIKIMLIGGFIMLTSPTSTHALMKAGYDDEIEPVGDGGDDMRIELPELGPAGDSDPAQQATAAATPPATKKPDPHPARSRVGQDDPAAAAVKKTTRKKSPRKKSAVKKVAAKKKATAKKAAKKATAKKATAKKVAKKAVSKKAAKKVATKNAATKKKSAAKKSPAKKITSKKKAPRDKRD